MMINDNSAKLIWLS